MEDFYPYQSELEQIEEEILFFKKGKKKRKKRRNITEQSYYDITIKEERNLFWSGRVFPENTKVKTEWTCLTCGKTWLAPYMNIYHLRSGCPHCNAKRMGLKLINDRVASKPQVKIAEMVNGIVNYPCGRKTIDVAIPELGIALEYDCSKWHRGRRKHDRERAEEILEDSRWKKVILIKTTTDLPTLTQIRDAIEDKEEISVIWLDWPD